jgi:alcohol dehydrogenase YqhD (iron-dependent ADH family)
MQPVTSWSCPTHIVIGAGSARRYVDALASSFVVADAALDWPADIVREQGVSDVDFIRTVQERRPPGATVVAVGGGSVLDPVRVAVAGLPPEGEGVRLVPASPQDSCEVVCVPSTIGTAAEVSPVAVLNAGSLMLISPALRAQVAVLDPDVTDNPDLDALRLALIEPWARVVVPMVAGDGLLLQDALAKALADVLEALVGQSVDGVWRQTAALTSAQTHTAFVALQRSPFSHVLWPLVMECAAMSGVSKQQALAALLPRWLDVHGRQDLAQVVRSLWPATDVEVDRYELDRRVRQRWPMFAAASAVEVLGG